MALVAVLLLAAGLRFPGLTRVPPGLDQDEAVNAWNAWCLLETGRDQTGTPWPIFYTRALGANRSTLFLYLLMPFQAVGGLNVWTTRLPTACAGILTVLLTYWVGRRMFGRTVAIASAALLAISPTHIQMSRWSVEAGITPLLALIPLAALLWAGLPLDDAERRPRPWRALLAGLLTGVVCYGYPAVRLFVPMFLCAGVLVTWRAWWRLLGSRRGALAVCTLLIGVTITFGPLAYKHITDPEHIGKRGTATWIWDTSDPALTRIGKVVDRYAHHFGPRFLFLRGDAHAATWTPGYGFLPLYSAPLLLVGLISLVRRLARSRAARVLLVGVVLYPVGDCLNWHVSLQSLRSSAGLAPLILLTALGLSWPVGLLVRSRLRAVPLALAAALAGLMLPETTAFLRDYFLGRHRQLAVQQGYHVDLLEACEWLRPRLDDVDVVVCTGVDMNQPYVIALVSLRYPPRRWFADTHDVRPVGVWDYHARFGKFHFLYPAERKELIAKLERDGRSDRVVLFLRPSETLPAEQPVHRIFSPDGRPALLVYDVHR